MKTQIDPIWPSERAKLTREYKRRRQEFLPATYTFDTAHTLAEQVAQLTLALLGSRADQYSSTEWYVSALHEVLHATAAFPSEPGPVFRFRGKRVEREEVLRMLAVSALVEAESRIK